MADKQWLKSASDMTVEQLIQCETTHRIDSIVVALEAVLSDKSILTAAERVVLAIEAMEREVNNGGFSQFFYNSSNEYASELEAALREIDAPITAKIVKRALGAIGAAADWTPEQFEDATAELAESVEEELIVCDDAYYESGEAISDKLFTFVKANPDAFEIGADSA